jgi:hypothetical protein
MITNLHHKNIYFVKDKSFMIKKIVQNNKQNELFYLIHFLIIKQIIFFSLKLKKRIV